MLSWKPLKRKVLARGVLESFPCGRFRVLTQTWWQEHVTLWVSTSKPTQEV